MRGSSGYPLVDRDGESCLDTVLRILQPPSIADNSFDPAPMETSWNNDEEDAPAFVSSFGDEMHDSVTFDIRTLFYQGCKGLVGAQCIAAGQLSAYQAQSDISRPYHTAAFHRWMHPSQQQTSSTLEQMTVDQEFYSTTLPMQKVMRGGPEHFPVIPILSRHKIVEQACQSFPESCIVSDEDTVDSTCNVMPCHYRFSSTYDAQVDNCSRGLDPGYYVQQTMSSSHELAGRLHPSDACELTALVRQHTSICVRQKSACHSSTLEQLAAHDNQTSKSSTWPVAERQDSSGHQANLSLFQMYSNEAQPLDVPPEPSIEVVPVMKKLEEDKRPREFGAMLQVQRALADYRSPFENASQLPSGLRCATVSDLILPRPQGGTHDYRSTGPEIRQLETQQPQTIMAPSLSDYDQSLTQAWREMMHASSTMHGFTDNDRSSQILREGLLQQKHPEEHDASVEELVDLALTKRPLTCSQVTDFVAAPVYSTRVSSEMTQNSDHELSRSVESQPSKGSSTTSTLRVKQLLDCSGLGSQGRAWVGIVHQELSSGLARLHQYCHSGLADQPRSPRLQVSTSAACDDEISVHQVTSQGCPSRLTPAQADFQPRTPEAKELKAAAASLMELCADSVQPVPLALKLPPKLTEVDMARLLQAYRHLNAFQVKKHFPFVKEADVYSLHPSDLIAGAGAGQYFFSETKYGSIKKPTRLRITKNGYRWKQQGRTFAIQEGGRTVAFKTYLSYVPLKTRTNKAQGQHPYDPYNCAGLSNQHQSIVSCTANQYPQHNNAASTTSSTTSGSPKQLMSADHRSQSSNEHTSGYCKQGSGSHRKWALWTMEEIALAEDVDMERTIFKRGGSPMPFPVLCKIGCRTPVEDGGHHSRNILPYAVPITRPALEPFIQERKRRPRGRHQLKRISKKAHFTGVILAASPGTDGSSVTGTCGTFHLPPSKSNPQLLLTC